MQQLFGFRDRLSLGPLINEDDTIAAGWILSTAMVCCGFPGRRAKVFLACCRIEVEANEALCVEAGLHHKLTDLRTTS